MMRQQQQQQQQSRLLLLRRRRCLTMTTTMTMKVTMILLVLLLQMAASSVPTVAATTTAAATATTIVPGFTNHTDDVETLPVPPSQRQRQHQLVVTLMDETEALPPLFPLRLQDYLGFGVAILGLLLAAGGGIGGGGILVPTYILLLDLPVKHAIPLASTTVFGGAVANNLLNARKAHPDHPTRSVIDWELITQLEPMTILGALLGAVLNDFLPDLVLVIMMVLLLTVTAYKMLVKAHKLNQLSAAADNEPGRPCRV